MNNINPDRIHIPGQGMVTRHQIALAFSLLQEISESDLEQAAWDGADSDLTLAWQKDARFIIGSRR